MGREPRLQHALPEATGTRSPCRSSATDPKMQVLQDFPNIVGFHGHPGPFTPVVQEVVATFILPDMFTRVARGQTPDEAVKWAVGEYRRIFAKYKRCDRAPDARPLLRQQPVTDAGLRQQIARLGGVLLELAPQVPPCRRAGSATGPRRSGPRPRAEAGGA